MNWKTHILLLNILLLLVTFGMGLIIVSADNDANSGGDAGNDNSMALSIIAGSYTGTLTGSDNSDRFDFYQIYLDTGDVINITMTPLESEDDFTLGLENPSQTGTVTRSQGPGEAEIIVYAADSSGGWYIIVNLPSLTAYDGDYTLDITVTPQNDANTGGDAGNDFGTASTISYGTFTGTLTDNSDEYDYYKIELLNGETFTAIMTPEVGMNFNLALYNPSQKSVAYSASGGEGISESFTYQANVTGIWYIVVQIPVFEYYNGDYTLCIVTGDTSTTFTTSITITSKPTTSITITSKSTTSSSNVITSGETSTGWQFLIVVPSILILFIIRKRRH